jgi:prevent-host-death family protein
MATVGIRELRQRASEILRRVEAGEAFEVTDRGRPVAILSPASEEGPLARMRAAGDVTPATSDIRDLPEPLTLGEGREAPSLRLIRRRYEER